MHATQDDGISCLFSATHFRRGVVVQKLLSFGVDPNVSNKVGLSPLHVAAAAGDVKLAKTLVYGKKINTAAIFKRTKCARFYCKIMLNSICVIFFLLPSGIYLALVIYVPPAPAKSLLPSDGAGLSIERICVFLKRQ